jgi:hypothetical protein
MIAHNPNCTYRITYGKNRQCNSGQEKNIFKYSLHKTLLKFTVMFIIGFLEMVFMSWFLILWVFFLDGYYFCLFLIRIFSLFRLIPFIIFIINFIFMTTFFNLIQHWWNWKIFFWIKKLSFLLWGIWKIWFIYRIAICLGI